MYSACVNVSIGSDLDAQLNGKFIAASGADPKKAEVSLYRGLYLSEDPSPENHPYGYASNLKLMAAIESKQLDIVLMNREAYDIFSQKGYLLDLQDLSASDDSLHQLLEPHLTANTVAVGDSDIEYALNEAAEEAMNGIDASMFPMFQEAGFPEPVYLGVIANSPRLPAVIQYIAYLAGAQNTPAG